MKQKAALPKMQDRVVREVSLPLIWLLNSLGALFMVTGMFQRVYIINF
jgi:hypothetical protein